MSSHSENNILQAQNPDYRGKGHRPTVEITYGSISGKRDNGNPVSNGGPVEPSRWVRYFPTGFKHELYELYKFSWPMALTMFLNFFVRTTGTMFSGQLGAIELDAVSMAVSIANLIGTSIGIGLIAGCDTLFSQSYGSINKKQVGVYLQTAIFISSLSCVVSWALLFNTNYLLLVLGQNPEVARSTEEFMYYFMPALYFLFIYQLLQKYLQVQGIIIPVVVIGVIANVVNVGLQYLFLHVLLLGIKGSAIGQTISYFILAVLTIWYARYCGAFDKTWAGWSKTSLRGWGEFMKLGLSSIAMICLEWWTYEVSAFLTGILGNVELGASSILYQIWTIYASIPLGISSACAFKIGRYLGERRPEAALTMTRVSIVMGGTLSVISGLVTLALHKQLAYLFSSDPAIIELATNMLLLLAIFNVFGCAKAILSGIIRGTGRQVAGGVISFVAYFLFAMPIGIPLMFLTSLRASGFWWGLIIGGTIAFVSLLIIVWRTNWQKEVNQAQVRARAKKKKIESSTTFPDDTAGLLGNGRPENSSDKSSLLDERYDPTLTQSFTFSTSFIFENPRERRKYWRNIIVQKLSITGFCFLLLVFGIICRFAIFIPPDLGPAFIANLNSTTVTVISADPSRSPLS